ncbi:unnamed protein product [Owenia fusiformis]|uniref:Uncharacterized protein n=1 Tax=Owenia fusiformis TaxID=6347 RepID=A0A8S4N9T5_OWEFU|nr:unnamed protein product [Owenia fusiformis]
MNMIVSRFHLSFLFVLFSHQSTGRRSCFQGTTRRTSPIRPGDCPAGSSFGCVRFYFQRQVHHSCYNKDEIPCPGSFMAFGGSQVVCCEEDDCNSPPEGGWERHPPPGGLGPGVFIPTSPTLTTKKPNLYCFGSASDGSDNLQSTQCGSDTGTCVRFASQKGMIYTCLPSDSMGGLSCEEHIQRLGGFDPLCCRTNYCNEPPQIAINMWIEGMMMMETMQLLAMIIISQIQIAETLKCHEGKRREANEETGYPLVECQPDDDTCAAYRAPSQTTTYYLCFNDRTMENKCRIFLESQGLLDVVCCKSDGCNGPGGGTGDIVYPKSTSEPSISINCYSGVEGSGMPIIPTECSNSDTCIRFIHQGQKHYTCANSMSVDCPEYYQAIGRTDVHCCSEDNCNVPHDGTVPEGNSKQKCYSGSSDDLQNPVRVIACNSLTGTPLADADSCVKGRRGDTLFYGCATSTECPEMFLQMEATDVECCAENNCNIPPDMTTQTSYKTTKNPEYEIKTEKPDNGSKDTSSATNIQLIFGAKTYTIV